MTRRDAALLTLTLAGMWCLFVAVTTLFSLAAVFSTASDSVMAPGNAILTRVFMLLPIAILSCAGIALLQSRRRLATWVFGANPSHDSTAQVDAGDIRLLAVRAVGLFLVVHLVGMLQSLNVFLQSSPPEISRLRFGMIASAVVYGIAVALCFFRGGTVVRWLFAAGPGERRSARYRDNMAFALGVIGAFYVLSFIGGVVTGVAETAWQAQGTETETASRMWSFLIHRGANLAMVLVGIALFIGRRGLATLWSKLHPMGADTE